MIQSRITELLGIDYPILQGGMAWIADAELAASVSQAGGLGVIASGNAPPEVVRAEIEKIRTLTDRPFGVNVMLLSPYVDEIAQLVADLRVPVLTTGAGNPARFMKLWKNAGIRVLPVVPSVAIAMKMRQAGADAVICEGCEAGGHIGDLTTLTLTPQIADALDIPVIAAGGIGDGRGIAAVFLLGAEGVQLGTRFLVSTSCRIHPNYKERIIAARDTGTIATGRRLGHPVRALKTRFTRDFASREYDTEITLEELEKMGTGALRLAVTEGDLERGCFMAGQIAGMVRREQSSREIITELFEEAERCLLGAEKLTGFGQNIQASQSGEHAAAEPDPCGETPCASNVEYFDRGQIMTILPHREDMLLIDRAEKHRLEDGTTEARAFYRIRGDEFFLRGHFPDRPIVPGVILCEIMGQSACVLVSEYAETATPYFTGMDRVKFKQKIQPGDRLEIISRIERSKHPFYFIRCEVRVGGKLCASAQLAFALIA